jgi:hypothetical protein
MNHEMTNVQVLIALLIIAVVVPALVLVTVPLMVVTLCVERLRFHVSWLDRVLCGVDRRPGELQGRSTHLDAAQYD